MTSSTLAKAAASAASSAANPLGSAPGYKWLVDDNNVNMAMAPPPPRVVTIDAQPQTVTIDLHRTALIVVDMQNDFCAKGGWVDHLGLDHTPDRAPIEPLQKLLPVLRNAGVHVIWLNWGNRPDLKNMAPNQLHLYKPKGTGIGLGEPLPGSGARVLQKDSWAAAVVDELKQEPEDIHVDKYRISGFWDTPLDSILRNLGTKTILFAGVNTDQCVLHSLTDANFLGYGCLLVEDCCATTSPGFCVEATLFNVKKCFGFVTHSSDVIGAVQEHVQQHR
ncbi:isochorismatase [Bradyrhizobium sp. UFLA03-84]|uniref:cysteine hydrolase family protein n=1 Tax=Bradyrhizobium sp. UFLA03-84 TaxID=418599 RepID=UPI000BAE12C2|nr:cysteine hydrolase family protein [Bradyrhizobium sp. UFLA03-84]PAY05239.1 isochorismatase [Bradyrhizobium sp. UFLA03-84]